MPPIDPESSSAEDTPIPTTTPRRGKKATRAQDAMSEDEAAPPRKTPRRDTKVAAAAAAAAVDDPMDEDVAEGGENGDKEASEDMDVDEDEEDGEDEEYVVEKIIDHKFDTDGVCRYLVKWKGYEKKSDQTWEPIEHLESGASDVLHEYWDKIGGKPTPQTKHATGRRGRPSQQSQTQNSATPSSTSKGRSRRGGTAADSAASTPAASTATPAASTTTAAAGTTASAAGSTTSGPTSRAAAAGNKWTPPEGTWEDDISAVDTIEQDEKGLHVYLQWNNGRKSKHPIEQTYRKCPQKMLHFYEQHLIFKDGTKEDTSATTTTNNAAAANGAT